MLDITNLCASWTNYIIDIVILAAFIGFGIVCAKKGFITCFLGFISWILAFFMALILTKLVVGVTNGLFGLDDLMAGGMEKTFLKIKGFNIDISSVGLKEALAERDLPKFLCDLIVDTFGKKDIAEGTTLAMVTASTLANVAIHFLTWLILFFLMRFVLFLVKKILNAIANKIQLIGIVNTILGAVVGIFECMLIVYAVLNILALIPSESITGYLNGSILAGFMYNHNLISVILGWIL